MAINDPKDSNVQMKTNKLVDGLDSSRYSKNGSIDFGETVKVKRVGGNYELIGFLLILLGAGLGVYMLSSTVFFVVSGVGFLTFLYGRFF